MIDGNTATAYMATGDYAVSEDGKTVSFSKGSGATLCTITGVTEMPSGNPLTDAGATLSEAILTNVTVLVRSTLYKETDLKFNILDEIYTVKTVSSTEPQSLILTYDAREEEATISLDTSGQGSEDGGEPPASYSA